MSQETPMTILYLSNQYRKHKEQLDIAKKSALSNYVSMSDDISKAVRNIINPELNRNGKRYVNKDYSNYFKSVVENTGASLRPQANSTIDYGQYHFVSEIIFSQFNI